MEEEEETTFRTVEEKNEDVYLIEPVPVWDVKFKNKISLCLKKKLPAEKLSYILCRINTITLILL